MQTVTVNGKPHNFPDTMSREDIQAALDARYGPKGTDPLQIPTETPKADKLEQLMQSLSERRARIEGAFGDVTGVYTDQAEELGIKGRRPRTPKEALVVGAGQTIGASMDILGAGFEAIVPDAIEEWTGDKVRQFFTETDTGRLLGEHLASGAEAWTNFADRYPSAAETIASAGNLAVLVGPKGKKMDLSKIARDLKGSGLAARQLKDKERIADLIIPKNKVGDGISGEKGFFRTATYEPSPDEAKMIQVLHAVDGVNPKRSFFYNLGQVERALPDEEKQLKAVLGKAHRNRWKVEDVAEDLTEAMDDMTLIPGYHTIVGDNTKVAQNLLADALKELQRAKKTPLGLLEARRKFDAVVQAGGDVLGNDKESAKKVVATFIRDTLNEKLQKIGGPDVYHHLNTQHWLLRTKDVLAARAAKEQRNALTRTWAKAKEFGHLPSTPLALMVLGGTVAPFYAPIGGAVAVGGLTWTAAKGLSKRNRNKALGEILSIMDKTRKSGLGKAALDDLKMDRQLIVELMTSDEAWANYTAAQEQREAQDGNVRPSP